MGAQVTDQFDVPDLVEFDFDLPDERGKWGWYKLRHPETMDLMLSKRVSTFGKVIGDRTALEKWGERMAVVGMSHRADLFSLVHGKDVRKDSKELNKLIADAKQAAGSSKAANLGTALHGFAEQVDCGRWTDLDVPAEHRKDIQAYGDAIVRSGLEVYPDLIERITYIPEFDVAGKFDRIFRLPDGSYVIGDLKTGSIEYSIMEIEIQLALYAQGVNTSGIWSKRDKKWLSPMTYGHDFSVPRVRQDIAVIVHLPVGKAECTLHVIDIERGWSNAQLCHQIHQARKEKHASTAFTDASELPKEKSLPDSGMAARFSSVTSLKEASTLYKEAKGQVSDLELKCLVVIAREALKKLANQG